MHKRIYKIKLSAAYLVCGLSFRQNFSTAHVSINQFYQIFVDLQKVFITVDHETLLINNHCGIREISFGWFKSNLPNRRQYVSINCCESGHTKIICGLPQG